MAQGRDELRIVLDHLKGLAERRVWQPGPYTPTEFRIMTVDKAENVSFSTVANLVAYAREEFGIDLHLSGGGYGCFEVGFAVQPDEADILDEAILNDFRFQNILNELNAHTALIRTRDYNRTYSAFYKLKIALATNRQKQRGHFDGNGVIDLFGSEPEHGNAINYGLAEAWIADFSQGQSKENLLKRAWHQITLRTWRARAGSHKVVLRQFDVMAYPEFRGLVEKFSGKGIILTVHGYANSFDDAMHGCAWGVYKARIHELGFLPVLFSWPSRGSAAQYLPDIASAENSEIALQRLLHLISTIKGDREANILAHSHGNKILVRSLCASGQSSNISAHRFRHIILVEPDVDREFFQQRANTLMQAGDHIVIYHSQNDRALAIAAALFDSFRLGRDGMSKKHKLMNIAGQIEVIDASHVAKGLLMHTPHIESPEVISDIYYLLRGMKPDERFHLRKVDAETGRWEMISV